MRGAIFDRAGQPLAKSLPAESICVNPLRITDVGVAADMLSRILEIDRARWSRKIESSIRRIAGSFG